MKPSPNPASWPNLPPELKLRKQWLLATPDKKGDLKVPATLNAAGEPAAGSSTDHTLWLEFDTACAAAAHYGLAIGYVVAPDDPYCCIDLDIKNQANEVDPANWSTDADVALCHRVMQTMLSYTESSQSGQGLHIWIRAKIGEGLKRKPVEVYSQGRFLVCTGNVVLNAPIEERQALVDLLVSEMRAAQHDTKAKLNEDAPERYDDEEICDRLGSHVNADKYFSLYKGAWQDLGYPSQSEADLALMSFYTFYSENEEQCRRLFRMSALGKREKATKNDTYLNRTLGIIRGRLGRDKALEAHGEQVAAAFLANARTTAPLQEPIATPPPLPHSPASASATNLPLPPGFTGAIAQYIYDSSPRPVREVSIVAALGLMAGLMGRGWNIPQSGLNLYVVLIARSAVGKEAMHSGISRIMQQCSTTMTGSNPIGSKILEFVDFSEYVSGPALSKAVAFNPCFVNVSGEWGRRLKALSAEEGRASGPLSSLRTVMTNLYQKSAAHSIVGGMGYSDKEKNVASVAGVAYSMIGETTPSTFYESLTEGMMSDGFLSRFTVIEYDGNRPVHNHTPVAAIDDRAIQHLHWIIHQAYSNKNGAPPILVQTDEESARRLADFDVHCDMQINCTVDESYRQMWNRGHLKVYRLAALLACADNPATPTISIAYVDWALDVVMRDIGIMTRRIREGDVGSGDVSRERKMLTVLGEFAKAPPFGHYNIPDAILSAGIIPRSYLQIRLQRVPSFAQHPGGGNKALDETLKNLLDSGYIIEVGKDKLATEFNYRGRGFRIVNLPSGYI